MSPEQVSDSSKVDPRTDIWSLGVVMYELLTGQPAFAGEGPIKIFAAIMGEQPRPVRLLNADVPEALEAVIARCLERDRDKRFHDVGEFAHAVASLLSNDDARRQLGDEARVYAREWGDAALAGRLATLYDGIARAAHSR